MTLEQKYRALEALAYDCDTRGGEITAWRDARPQPATWEEIIAAAAALPPPIPAEVSMAQFRLALLDAGIDPDAITQSLGADRKAKIRWEYSATVRREHPLVAAMAAKLKKTEAEVDAIFSHAATL